jgi:3'-phosphoadenosine 5'-phosphosulfate sulfotransferase (PAPS reductase)/FAD synthetase
MNSSTHLPNLRSYDVILVNTSAGKDSQAMLDLVVEMATAAGVRDRLVAVHCDLGRVEWAGTKELAERQAAHYGVRLEIVSRPQGDLLSHVEERGKWPSSTARYCTSDHKRGQVRKLLTQLADEGRAAGVAGRPVRILNCMGMRAEESPARSKLEAFEHCASLTCPCDECDVLRATAAQAFAHEPKKAGVRNVYCECEACAPIAEAKRRLADGNSNSRRHVDDYLPIHAWSTADVWARIKTSGVEHHRAYDLGMKRLSCVFCIFAPESALLIAGKHNPELLAKYVDVETKINHSFRQGFRLKVIQDKLNEGVDTDKLTGDDAGCWNM